jgi:hypothetical protein
MPILTFKLSRFIPPIQALNSLGFNRSFLGIAADGAPLRASSAKWPPTTGLAIKKKSPPQLF